MLMVSSLHTFLRQAVVGRDGSSALVAVSVTPKAAGAIAMVSCCWTQFLALL